MKRSFVILSTLLAAGCAQETKPAPVFATNANAPAVPTPAPPATASAAPAVVVAPPAAMKTVQVGVGDEVPADLALPILADAPAVAEPARGLAGFFTEDGTISTMIREISGHEAKTTMEESVKELSPMTLRWLTKERTADGWLTISVMPGFDDKGDRKGDVYAFEMRRAIAGKQYICYGGAPTEAAAAVNLAICRSLRAK